MRLDGRTFNPSSRLAVDNPFSGPDILDSPAHRELCEGWNQVSYTHSIDPPIPLGTDIY